MTRTSSGQRNQAEYVAQGDVAEDPRGAAPARPLRADARRNVDRLLAAAREAFSARGADTSLDDIAKRAGVGPGTLYRHFPTRAALIEAVYLDGVVGLCATGDRLLETEPPDRALVDWLRAFVTYVGEKHGLPKSLLESVDNRDEVFRKSHEMIERTGTALVDGAKQVGAVRPDVQLYDLIRLVSALALAGEQSPEGPALSNRLLDLAVEGLRRRPEA